MEFSPVGLPRLLAAGEWLSLHGASAGGRSFGGRWPRRSRPRQVQKACQCSKAGYFAAFSRFMAAGLLDFAQLAQKAGDYPAAEAWIPAGSFMDKKEYTNQI
ncbi:hypothetical protein [Azotobacter salinestris]|uniref:hypothetical protein n=1 Tax=Azotobacter salinestris TaxID=69964 RepID=UPI0032DFBA98